VLNAVDDEGLRGRAVCDGWRVWVGESNFSDSRSFPESCASAKRCRVTLACTHIFA
jgi:hypothetical protein